MEELRSLAIDGIIADFVENPPSVLDTDYVSGVSLRIDPFWLSWKSAVRWGPIPYSYNASGIVLRDLRGFHGYRHDFSLLPPTWSSYCKRRGYPSDAHPVTVVVILRAPFDPKVFLDAPRSVGPHPIVYEHRPEAVGYLLAPGDFLGCAAEGTLGGFLWHTSDSTYQAMSCAHVLGQKGRAYSPRPNLFGAKTEIGSVTFCSPPISPSTKCNRKIQPNAPVIDMALVTVDAATATSIPVPGVGSIASDTPIANMDQGDQIRFVGQKSGHTKAKIAEMNIWKEIKINGARTCFSDLFVIDHLSYPYIASSLAQPGDSGAWVVHLTGTTAPSWDGMLIGGDGIRAYCCFAENIMNTLSGEPLILP